MTTSLWKVWRKAKASRAARTQASGSSPFTWKIGAWTILATSVGYTEVRADAGRGGEAELVVDDDVHRAAGAVAGQARQVERLGHHALAGEGGVAVDEHGHAREPVRRPRPPRPGVPSVGGESRSCLARVMPSTTGSTASRCDGFDARVMGSSSPALPWNVPRAPLWYFTSPEPWTDSGSRLPSNSSKISR